MNPLQLRELIVSVLKRIGRHTQEATDLLMLTAAQESHCGKYIKQLGGGPARGIFQMEPTTLEDLCENFLRYRPGLSAMLAHFKTDDREFDLTGNIPFQIATARVHYMRFPEAIPKRREYPGSDTGFDQYIKALANYWKIYWNTGKGAGTLQEAFRNYHHYVIGGMYA